MWLLKELQVTWTPEDPYRYYKLSKRALTKKQVREEMLQERRQKTEQVREELEAEKEKFYEMKRKVLTEINNDINRYKLNKEELMKTFKNQKLEAFKKEIEASKKLNKLARTIKEQKEQKIRDRKVF